MLNYSLLAAETTRARQEKQELELVPRLVDFFSQKNGDMILTPKVCSRLRGSMKHGVKQFMKLRLNLPFHEMFREYFVKSKMIKN